MAKERNILCLYKSKLDSVPVDVEIEEDGGNFIFTFSCDSEDYQLVIAELDVQPLVNFLNKHKRQYGSIDR